MPIPDDDIYAKAVDDSGSAIPIVTGPTDDYQPALSPDGQSLCFTRGAFGSTDGDRAALHRRPART